MRVLLTLVLLTLCAVSVLSAPIKHDSRDIEPRYVLQQVIGVVVQSTSTTTPSDAPTSIHVHLPVSLPSTTDVTTTTPSTTSDPATTTKSVKTKTSPTTTDSSPTSTPSTVCGATGQIKAKVSSTQQTLKSAAACADACHEDSYCLSSAFDSTGPTCYLIAAAAVNAISAHPVSNGVELVFYDAVCDVPNPTPVCGRVGNVIAGVTALSSRKAKNLHACEVQCSQMALCQSFGMTAAGQCKLFSGSVKGTVKAASYGALTMYDWNCSV